MHKLLGHNKTHKEKYRRILMHCNPAQDSESAVAAGNTLHSPVLCLIACIVAVELESMEPCKKNVGNEIYNTSLHQATQLKMI